MKRLGLGLVVWVVTLSLYLHTRTFGFVWDDRALILESPVLTGETPAWAVFTPGFWRHQDLSQGDAYRPLVKLSYLVSRWVSPGPASFHCHNALLHSTNALLLYGFLLALGAGAGPAALVALFAACHPIQSESVAWVKNRAELLAACAGLVALLALAYARRGRAAGVAGGIVSVVAFAAALLCKTTAIVYLPLLCLAAWQFGRGKRWGYVAGAYALVAAGYLLLRNGLGGASSSASALAVLARLTPYLRLFFWPVGLSAHHPFQPTALLAVAAVGGIAGLALVAGRSRWRWSALIAAAVLLAPALLGGLALRPIAEQRAYAAAWAGAAVLLPALARSLRVRWLLALAIIVMASLTIHRAFAWRSDATLWRDTIRQSGLAPRALTNLGLTWKQQGRLRPALWAFGQASKLDPHDVNPLYNAGPCWLALRDWDKAAAAFGRVVALEPDKPHAAAWAGLAFAQAHRGNLPRAEKAIQRAKAAAFGKTPQQRLLLHEVQRIIDEKRRGR